MLAFQITTALLFTTFFLIVDIKPVFEDQQAHPAISSNSQSTLAVPGAAPQSCPITEPPVHRFVPPSPYPSKSDPNGFWFGSEKLWIQLPADGTWSDLPHYRPTDTAFRQKIQWWRKGYNSRTENIPKLNVTGTRLDASAPPLATDEHANNVGGIPNGTPERASMMTGIFLPTLGCWQITGDYKGDKLTFVIWVAP